ncbi:Histone H1 [Penicillium chermesinum]|nr:Histone H1 [Penicillium chermesinum]
MDGPPRPSEGMRAANYSSWTDRNALKRWGVASRIQAEMVTQKRERGTYREDKDSQTTKSLDPDHSIFQPVKYNLSLFSLPSHQHAPKKATGASKKAAAAPHTSYRDMIKDAIVNLKERNGSSRQAIKKYVQSNNKITYASQSAFDAQFNKAIKAGVDKNEFTQPKGPSGPVKLAKKEAAPKPAAKPAAKATTKAAAPKAAPKKATATKAAAKKAAPKKTATKAAKPAAKKATATKKTAAKPKANSGKARKTKAPTAAPAIVEQPKVISTTKSGRVTKTTAPPAKPAVKKRTTKK